MMSSALNLTRKLPLIAAIAITATTIVNAKPAHALTAAFDNLYSNNSGFNPAASYSAQGLTISGNYFGIVGGVANGDPGNWGLNGTNGPVFLGCNQAANCSPTFTFASLVTGFSIDVGVRAGTTDNFTIQAFQGATSLGTATTGTFTGSGASGTWRTLSFAGPLTRVVLSSTTPPFSAYGMDNVNFTPVPVPFGFTPLPGLALAWVGGAVRRSRQNRKKAETSV
ncbi:hypothetical protein [Leptolyngbya sp. FACHB-17]|uniref:hypothetical protein n=1 Tax=unclassified Leptolyngbya TaxID=2650499 RepID=UPI00167FE7F2|nr:hypothetical protein [Leptolyngbya sp. FACHB-17]MBD2082694.1 hypothetical protein [Leptolyngbya sp. FACHB-17]